MKKFTRIIAIVAALAMGASIAGCTKTQTPPQPDEPITYPDYVNDPDFSTGEDTSQNKYVVNVQSVGGMPLNNVTVDLKDAQGNVLKSSVSRDGKAEFSVALGEYTLEVRESSLPAGYYLDDTVYTTDPDSREEVTIKLPSAVITTPSSTAISYSLGDIMYDFTFTDSNGQSTKLSDALKTKKAVVINLFYTTCGPCQQEFPAIQKAYENYKNDIAFFGMCWTGYGDSDASINSLKNQLGLTTLPLGMDTAGIVDSFGVNAFPTTYIVDRYGMVAYRSSGSDSNESAWNALFAKYISEDYTQSITTGDGSGDDNSSGEMVKPDVSMPSSTEIARVLNDSSVNATYRADTSDEYVWPWIITNDDDGQPCVSSANVNVDRSLSALICEVDMREGDLISFDYKVNTEAGIDLFYVVIDNENMTPNGISGDSEGWQSYDLYVADRDKKVEIIFTYQKDAADEIPDEDMNEQVKIRNLRITRADDLEETKDVLRPAAEGMEGENPQQFSYYKEVVYNEEDGLYHVGDKNGPLLLLTLDQLTPWTTLRMGNNVSSDGSYYNTMSEIIYYEFSNKQTGGAFKVTIDGTDYTTVYLNYKSASNLLTDQKRLMPVTKELHDMAVAFCNAMASKQNRLTIEDTEWLELCYYYDHYGPEHDNCPKDTDVTKGLTIYTAYTAHLDTDKTADEMYNPETGKNRVKVTIAISEAQRGNYYKFVAPQAGVYRVRSYNITDTTGLTEEEIAMTKQVSHYLYAYDENGNIYNRSFVEVRDYDQHTDGVRYDGFNGYFYLDEGETMYVRAATYYNTTGMYDFTMTYMGEELDVLYTASLGGPGGYVTDDAGNLWYDAIDVVYDSATDRYYKKGANGAPDMNSMIYIDLLRSPYMGGVSLKSLYESGKLGDSIGIIASLPMADYIAQLDSQDPDSPTYGFVEATQDLASMLQLYCSKLDDMQTLSNDWLAFAVYYEHFGA